MNQLLTNWRTTSSGILSLAMSGYTLVAAFKKGTMDQALFGVCVTGILTGVGLIFSRDSQASAADKADTKVQIADLQTQVNQVKGDTSQLNKP